MKTHMYSTYKIKTALDFSTSKTDFEICVGVCVCGGCVCLFVGGGGVAMNQGEGPD